jgi:hypothetical protein
MKNTTKIIREILKNDELIIKNCREQRKLLSKLHEIWSLTEEQYDKRDESVLDEMFSTATEAVHYFEKLWIPTEKAYRFVDVWLYD